MVVPRCRPLELTRQVRDVDRSLGPCRQVAYEDLAVLELVAANDGEVSAVACRPLQLAP